MRNLVIVLGDQLDRNSAAFDGFDPALDAILMMEVRDEATYIPQHKRRLVCFFAAMRHFAEEQREVGRRVHYVELDDPDSSGDFGGEIRRAQQRLNPESIIVSEPGDWRVLNNLRRTYSDIDIRPDNHFLCSRAAFVEFANSHPTPLLETFYRFMRKRLSILMDDDGEPVGGAWNFDKENRAAFGKNGLPLMISPPVHRPDQITQDVIALVEREFADSPGRLDQFDLPVTRSQALAELDDFVRNRLVDFGRYQDAMVSGEHLLFHSRLSVALNLHLLDPREVIAAVLANPARAPINSVEGFIRQILGWREFVRGVYWLEMPHYADQNRLGADLPVPAFFWTGDTPMRCLSQAIGHTIDHAYAHHIERLMVLGQFCLLLGVHPYDVHRWHMSMFADAIDWVSLPNTLGMSQHGDGGRVGTKPYAASGAYINRMSDHCGHCHFDPRKATGDKACPFTTLYWDFLDRHREQFAKNQRMKFQYVNLDRKAPDELALIRLRADQLKRELTSATFLKRLDGAPSSLG